MKQTKYSQVSCLNCAYSRDYVLDDSKGGRYQIMAVHCYNLQREGVVRVAASFTCKEFVSVGG